MTDNERGELFKKAAEARLKSYSPYSGYSAAYVSVQQHRI